MVSEKEIKHLIDVAAQRTKADLVIRNAKVIDVFNGRIVEKDVAIANGLIVGLGSYEAKEVFDAGGRYLSPGLIDAHVHIESSLLDPASFANLIVPHGTTTVIVDPHEICNVTGLDGFDYMLNNSKELDLSIFIMVPSCVPSTPFEHAGAILDAQAIASRIDDKRVLGLGEMMDMVGTVNAEEHVIAKLLVAHQAIKIIDGHAPMLKEKELNAFVVAGVRTDHEGTTPEELLDRIERGMYVMLREGSASHDLIPLLKGVTKDNSRYCLFCTDDRQPFSILKEGHIDNHLRIAIKEGLEPIEAIRMATINASECYSLKDRGSISPGRRADLVLFEDLKDFKVLKVWCKGEKFVASEDKLSSIPTTVAGKVNIGSFTKERLKLKLDRDTVKVIEIIPNSLITKESLEKIERDENGFYQNKKGQDIVKLAVIERHKGSGNVGLALLKGLKLKNGAIATTIAHDSHNVIVAGDNDEDMNIAIEALVKIGGGIVMVQDKTVVEALELPIAGLMTNKGALYVKETLERMHAVGVEKFNLDENVDSFTILSFMALPVIPHLKVTDMGLFNVDENRFVSIEA